MINKYIKASLLVLLMASSVSLTSCKKKDDPKPNKTELDKAAADKAAADKAAADKAAADKAAADKAAADKAEKARVEKAIIGKWQHGVSKKAFQFMADGTLHLHILTSNKREKFIGTFKVSEDGKQITMLIEGEDSSPINITITNNVLTIKSDKFDSKDYFRWELSRFFLKTKTMQSGS